MQYLFKCAVLCYCGFCLLQINCFVSRISKQLSQCDATFTKACGSKQPEEHAGLRTSKCDLMQEDIFGVLLLTYKFTFTNLMQVGHTEYLV